MKQVFALSLLQVIDGYQYSYELDRLIDYHQKINSTKVFPKTEVKAKRAQLLQVVSIIK